MPTSVFLIRHGAYEHRPSLEGDAASDFGLSELGRQQGCALRDRLARSQEIQADALFCSTLTRAQQTAELIAPVLGLPLHAVPELCEWESGNEAIGLDLFMARFQALSPTRRLHHRFHPSCETLAEFAGRVQSKLAELLQAFAEKTLVIVAHGGVIEVAFAYFLGVGRRPFEGEYPAAGQASITLWRRATARDDWVQEFANDTHHLRSDA